MTTLAQFRDAAIARLEAAGVVTPETDADLLIGSVLELSRGEVQAKAIGGLTLAASQLDHPYRDRFRRRHPTIISAPGRLDHLSWRDGVH